MNTNVRNVLIILVIAAAVAFVPAAGRTAEVISYLVSVLFLGAIGWFLIVMYRQNRVDILSLDDRLRALLYGSIGLAVLTVTATPQLWDTPAGVFAWFALVAGASYGVFFVWRAYRSY